MDPVIASGTQDSEEFGCAKRDLLEALLGMPNEIPSHDTFGRVFAKLDAEQFEAIFVNRLQHLHELFQGQLLGHRWEGGLSFA